jgi:cyclase
LLLASLVAAQDAAQVAPSLQPLRGTLQLLSGAGSNIVVSSGRQGTLMVDAEYAASSDRLLATLALADLLPVKTLINTHWHEDHVGANAALARQGALIIASQHTAERLRSDQTMSLYGAQPALPAEGWPRVALRDPLRLAWNGTVVQVIPVAPAHTDADAIVVFPEQNVLVTGDLFVGYDFRPPYFDDLNGGSAEGMLSAADRLLGIADAGTIIVPGHGAVTDRAELQRYRNDFAAVRDVIREHARKGMSEDAVVGAHPAADFARAGRGTDRWVRIVYRETKQGMSTR